MPEENKIKKEDPKVDIDTSGPEVDVTLPEEKIEKEKLTNGINIIDLVIASNLSNSKSEVKRMIKNKGIKINNETVENDKLNVSLNSFKQENFLKLSHGKKNHVILKIV